jgi:hypothetical protein
MDFFGAADERGLQATDETLQAADDADVSAADEFFKPQMIAIPGRR